jgi:HAD superfamily hydrolase (TIGR01509 family)
MPTITLVCFDWGGVLIEVARTWQEACQRAGLPVRLAEISNAFAGSHGAGDRFQRGEIEFDAYCQIVVERLAGTYTAAEVVAIHDAVLIAEYPGAAELVSELNRQPGIETALLSNTNSVHYAHRERYPGVAAVKRPFASHLLGIIKPDAEIFRALERATERTPEQILFFDDLVANVVAARRAGWRAEQIDPFGDPIAQMRRHLHKYGVLFSST